MMIEPRGISENMMYVLVLYERCSRSLKNDSRACDEKSTYIAALLR
jgi:hypothetical protein